MGIVTLHRMSLDAGTRSRFDRGAGRRAAQREGAVPFDRRGSFGGTGERGQRRAPGNRPVGAIYQSHTLQSWAIYESTHLLHVFFVKERVFPLKQRFQLHQPVPQPDHRHRYYRIETRPEKCHSCAAPRLCSARRAAGSSGGSSGSKTSASLRRWMGGTTEVQKRGESEDGFVRNGWESSQLT